jgi:peptidoglycan hydrolase-like protein with peptidoglycan-binding domain
MKPWALVTAIALLFTIAATPVLAQRGADIEQLQKALKQQGHDPGPIDGEFGPQTSAALRAYQQAQGLNATGQIDDATLVKLGEATQAAETESRPEPSASPATGGDKGPATGGDTRPSAVDPAQATKTGANAGEGASYSRSTEKGQSTMKDGAEKK